VFLVGNNTKEVFLKTLQRGSIRLEVLSAPE
jgi:hypothetical protein